MILFNKNEIVDPDADTLELHPKWEAVDQRIAALEAENAGLRADAERYQFIRRKACIVGDAFHVINLPRPTYATPYAATALDEAIDAARLPGGRT